MDAGILKAGQSAIDVLLKLKGTETTLRAKGSVRLPGGGYDLSGGAFRAAQKFSFRAASAGTGSKGEDQRKQLEKPWTMTGRLDAEVEPGDTGAFSNMTFTVDKVDRTSEFKTVCEITCILVEAPLDGV